MGFSRIGRMGRRRATAILAAFGLVAALFVAQQAPEARAVTGSEFDPGFIISDQVFFKGDAISEAQTQSFLEAMAPSCAGANGVTCLKNYTQSTTSRAASASAGCAAYNGAANERASRILVKVGVACGINPQVLIVMLQKEQGLVTKSSPTPSNYRIAMGYGCPDTAPCDAQFYGFYNQVYKAAWQLKIYGASPSSWRYHVGNVAVQFHPNAGCGSTVVNIRNQATASLYNYTPYQPNASALANLRGLGDSCGSYGNRNFWVYFNDWFGDTGTAGVLAIDELYQQLGGSAGSLGAPVGGINSISANGGGLVRAFANGAIAWSRPLGAHVVAGEIRVFFNVQGGIAGALGWPASPANANSSRGGGTVQAFQNGAITRTTAGQLSTLSGPIRVNFGSTGGLAGPLGWPLASAVCADGGCTQSFDGGTIYWTESRGAHSVQSAFAPLFASTGGTSGSLGWPTSDPNALTVSGGSGIVQGFDKGAITQVTGAAPRILSGPIRTAFNAAGGLAGAPGWPTSDAVCQGPSCVQQVQGGVMRAEPTRGAFFTPSVIEAAYSSAGGVSGRLGWPVGSPSAITANGGGIVQAFQNGAIAYSATGGAHAISGDVRVYFNTQGGIAGPLGWPTGDQVCSAGGVCTQRFMGGLVNWSPTSGGSVTR